MAVVLRDKIYSIGRMASIDQDVFPDIFLLYSAKLRGEAKGKPWSPHCLEFKLA
jgi:hypothetical protein